MDNDVLQWTDHFKYLYIYCTAGSELCVNVVPMMRLKFCMCAACNSIIAHSHGLAEPVHVQLVKSFCLLLTVYCIGGLLFKRLAICQLSLCWSDSFRRDFSFKRSESDRILQIKLNWNQDRRLDNGF